MAMTHEPDENLYYRRCRGHSDTLLSFVEHYVNMMQLQCDVNQLCKLQNICIADERDHINVESK